MTGRVTDTDELYRLLGALQQLRGSRTLSTVTARDLWPSHGLYFFYEAGETRSNGDPRVVRVGTHALRPTSKTTLWGRLAQHRGRIGGSNPGGGNHRGSIFRLHVGAALLRREEADTEYVKSWLGSDPDSRWRDAERDHERAVSRYIGAMPFLWLPVATRPDGTSDRGYLERNCIALLSAASGGVEQVSETWLGRHAVNPAIARSGLWNVNHVDEQYDPRFLQVMAAYVENV